MSRITAVFDHHNDAQAALNELRELGISDQHLTFSSRDHHGAEARPDPDGTVNADGGNTDTLADTGSLHRPAVLVPPIANAGVPVGLGGLGSPGAGAVLAAAALDARNTDGDGVNPRTHRDVNPERESQYYDDALRSGKTLISVDAEDSVQEERVRDILARHRAGFYTP